MRSRNERDAAYWIAAEPDAEAVAESSAAGGVELSRPKSDSPPATSSAFELVLARARRPSGRLDRARRRRRRRTRLRHDERVDAALGRRRGSVDAVVLQSSSAAPTAGSPTPEHRLRGALVGRRESGSAIRLAKTRESRLVREVPKRTPRMKSAGSLFDFSDSCAVMSALIRQRPRNSSCRPTAARPTQAAARATSRPDSPDPESHSRPVD